MTYLLGCKHAELTDGRHSRLDDRFNWPCGRHKCKNKPATCCLHVLDPKLGHAGASLTPIKSQSMRHLQTHATPF